jgi:hypothetical protein
MLVIGHKTSVPTNEGARLFERRKIRSVNLGQFPCPLIMIRIRIPNTVSYPEQFFFNQPSSFLLGGGGVIFGFVQSGSEAMHSPTTPEVIILSNAVPQTQMIYIFLFQRWLQKHCFFCRLSHATVPEYG